MKSLLLTFSLILGSAAAGAIVRIDYRNGPGFELKDLGGMPLTAGNLAAAQDGAIIQVGYYSLATTSDPFAGSWIPLLGPGLPDPDYSTIGDKIALAGRFSGEGGFGETPPFPLAFPTIGTPMSLRFYDATSVAGAGYFNAVSSTTWIWNGPATPEAVIAMNLVTSPLVWQDGPGSAFRTTIPVPEPSAALLLLVAGLPLLSRRDRSA